MARRQGSGGQHGTEKKAAPAGRRPRRTGDGNALLWRAAAILTAGSIAGLGVLMVTQRRYEPPGGGGGAADDEPGRGAEARAAAVDRSKPPTVRTASPRLVSNQTSYPLIVYGEGFAPDDVVVLSGPQEGARRELPTAWLDPEHLTARLPAAIGLPTNQTFGRLAVGVRRAEGLPGEGSAPLTLVNDATYPVPFDLAARADGSRVFVASPTTDAVWFVDLPPGDASPGAPQPLPVGDAPRALARFVDDGGGGAEAGPSGAGEEGLAVLHGLAPELWVLSMADPRRTPRVIPIPGALRPEDLAVVDGSPGTGPLAFLTDRGRDAVFVVGLRDGRLRGRFPTAVNPSAIAVAPAWLGPGGAPTAFEVHVASLGAETTHRFLVRGDGAAVLPEGSTAAAPDGVPGGDRAHPTPSPGAHEIGPGTPILGGHTEPFRPYVMGPKAPRDLVAWAFAGDGPEDARVVSFAAGIGPNIGPNPERMEVSMNGGITVDGRVHVSMGSGIPQGLALVTEATAERPNGRGVLYVADVGRGTVVAFDAGKLAFGDDRGRRRAELARVAIPPPEGTTLLRPPAELGVDGRAGPELHTGPWALALGGEGRLFVLGRLSGQVVELDTRRVRGGRLRVVRSFPGVPLRAQPQRRLGEVAYYTDLGGSRMSCDACHVGGREGGLLFAKGEPMHIYRSPTLLSIAESPPYFTPAMIPSLAATAEVVLGRNRYHNPDPSRLEIRALGLYQAALVEPPNPFRGSAGELPPSLPAPAAVGGPGDDGGGGAERPPAEPRDAGSPTRGLALFEGKGRCADCHAAPSFTTDQDEATRGRTHDVGTPNTLPLRLEMQDDGPYPLPPPSLLGVWDHFPLLDSGAGGYTVVDGERVEATHPDAIGRVLELGAESGEHGALDQLTPAERRDLAAYLRTL
jgi:mono/diheme cytochrome c family protein